MLCPLFRLDIIERCLRTVCELARGEGVQIHVYSHISINDAFLRRFLSFNTFDTHIDVFEEVCCVYFLYNDTSCCHTGDYCTYMRITICALCSYCNKIRVCVCTSVLTLAPSNNLFRIFASCTSGLRVWRVLVLKYLLVTCVCKNTRR